ncbi:MAG: glycosyl transferase group 1 family protein [Sphingobacteriales bacterium]|nr:glycosyl transferase group 1 family protein [Sphingobacteriales bacterium]
MIDILFDNQIFNSQEFGGISRYFSELIMGLKKDSECNIVQKTYYSNNIHLHTNNLTSYDKLRTLPLFRGKSRIENYIKKNESNQIKNFLRSRKFDIFHPTYYNSPFLSDLPIDKPLVITVHDMIHELYLDKKFECLHPETIEKKKLIQRADHIIAVSQDTKRNILFFNPNIDENKITVIHHGSSFPSKHLSHKKPLHGRYLLYVGNRKFYKNFQALLTSISFFLRKEKILLVCAGGGDFDNYEAQIIANQQLKNIVVFQKIKNDTDLENLYRNAICFIFPSLYEGFGIPILEAFACGCPVLLSEASCFPEVAGDAALYFRIGDDESLMNQLWRILNNNEIREDLINKGTERSKDFSWEITVEQHKTLYKTLL